MNKILFIYSSPIEKSKSISTQMGNLFLEKYKEQNKTDSITIIDLNSEKMAQKNMTSLNFGSYFNEEDSDKYINQLKESDKVVICAPMINFNFPVTLKNYLDHILVANKTFSYKYNKNGQSEGLLKNLKIQLLTSQGADFGWYPWGNHTENLKGVWEFVGASVVKPITIFGTKTPSKIQLSAEEVVSSEEENIIAAAQKF